MQADPHRFEEWILGSLTSGIVAIDQDGRLVTLNAGAQRILGCPQADLDAAIGRDCREILHGQPAVARLLLDTLDGRAPLSRAELVLEGEGGGRLPSTIGFTLAPVRDADGRVRGAAILFRDLTPFERSYEQDRLRERLAALGQMAAGMAHEIRNPLASMEVLAGLLKRRLEDPEALELVAQLRGELRTVAETISASLEFVRPVALSRSRVDARELVEESLRIATQRVRFEGEIERRYATDLPELCVDEGLLRGVLTNLILNAFEAMSGEAAAQRGEAERRRAPAKPARLSLCVQARPAAPSARSVRVGADGRAAAPPPGAVREVAIAVSDTGPGVAEELREKIFYPFFTTKERGSGVGLAMAQKVVSSHGGVLELESARGAGATFRVRLPVSGEGGA